MSEKKNLFVSVENCELLLFLQFKCVNISISTVTHSSIVYFFRARRSPPPQVRMCPYAYGRNRLGSLATVCVQRSYGNKVIVDSMDKIINIFGQRHGSGKTFFFSNFNFIKIE